MLALLGVVSITGSTCLACVTTGTRYECEIDAFSGILLIAGLGMIGTMLAVPR